MNITVKATSTLAKSPVRAISDNFFNANVINITETANAIIVPAMLVEFFAAKATAETAATTATNAIITGTNLSIFCLISSSVTP